MAVHPPLSAHTPQVEAYPAFGRGAVRAARIKKLLEDPSWNWCGFATFFFVFAVLGIIVVLSLQWTSETADISNGAGWVAAFGVPVVLTLLKLFVKVFPGSWVQFSARNHTLTNGISIEWHIALPVNCAS